MNNQSKLLPTPDIPRAAIDFARMRRALIDAGLGHIAEGLTIDVAAPSFVVEPAAKFIPEVFGSDDLQHQRRDQLGQNWIGRRAKIDPLSDAGWDLIADLFRDRAGSTFTWREVHDALRRLIFVGVSWESLGSGTYRLRLRKSTPERWTALEVRSLRFPEEHAAFGQDCRTLAVFARRYLFRMSKRVPRPGTVSSKLMPELKN